MRSSCVIVRELRKTEALSVSFVPLDVYEPDESSVVYLVVNYRLMLIHI